MSLLLKDAKIKLLNLNEFPKIKMPDENGKTFEENAKIKSEYGFALFNQPCFADDSGICVEALNGKPGVRSKRFIDEIGSEKKTFKLIINETEKKLNSKAYFQTTIALTFELEQTIFFTGKIYGKIAKKPSGDNGFGYDPIFIPNGFNKTYGEMTFKEKSSVSHRFLASCKLEKYLQKSNS